MQIESRIHEVTVYTDRALVGRTATVELAPGTHHLRVGGLTTMLHEDSLRVRAEGEAEVILHGFNLRTAYVGRANSEQVVAQETMLQSLLDGDRTLADAQSIQNSQLQALQHTTQQLAGSFTQQLSEGHLKLHEWEDTLAFLEAQQTKVSARLLEIEQQRRRMAERREALEAELEKLQSFQGDACYEAVVTVEVLQGGRLTLLLEYVTWGASWAPAYDARLSQAGDRLDWRYYGLVSQETGEHWENVSLRLSTARPAESSNPPTVSDWFLSAWRPEPPRMQARMEEEAGDMPPAPPMPSAPAPAKKEARAPQAVVAEQGTSVTMAVVRPLTIPSDGEPHQAPIGLLELAPKLRYMVIPKVRPHVYLEVEALYEGAWPLLSGPVKAFVGQDYVGTIPLADEVMPGQSFKLPMGVDRALQVERKRLKKNTGEGGLLKKERFAEYRYELVLTSYKQAPQSVVVIEPVPQSTQEDIRVKLGEMNVAAKQDEPGQLSWEVQVVPREPQKLTWGYRVEYPTALTLMGLE
ncbi:MAG TPA: mucoidy inhibitor MuiA family protein [Oscillatoriaceae cyanobacterium]